MVRRKCGWGHEGVVITVVWSLGGFESVHRLSSTALEDVGSLLCRQGCLFELLPSLVSSVEMVAKQKDEQAGDCRCDRNYNSHQRD
jgi:hypothetical protein